METNRIFILIAAAVFLLIAVANLWRLLVGFPVEIGGVFIGNTISFFAFVAGAGLSLMLFRAARR